MTRIERLSITATALVAVAVPGFLLGFWSEPVPRDIVPPPLLAPREGAAVTAAYRRDLFGAGETVTKGDELPSDAPDLTGIVGRIGQDAVALVRSGGATRTIAVGAAVDGWTLESLAIDAAYFTRGGQKVRVPLPAGD